MTDTAGDTLYETVFAQMPFPLQGGVGVAVSGGSDSMALMLILAEWGRRFSVPVSVVTVDHGLRAEAAEEALFVKKVALQQGLTHHILRWQGWDGAGNLPDQARRARYDLILGWAAEQGLGCIAVGHTADDQAETVLMRMARAAGVDGLSAMSAKRRLGSVDVLRPLLGTRRAELRRFLTARGQSWADDPTNDNPRYDRIKARQALAVLEPLGITVPALVQVAANLAETRKAMEWHTFLGAREMVRIENGDIVIDHRRFRTVTDEVARRLLVRAICWISQSEYPPRRRSVALLCEAIRSGSSFSLHGCRVVMSQQQIRIIRDLPAVAELRAGEGEFWDNRWAFSGPWEPGLEVRALRQAGLTQCPDWRDLGLSAAILMPRPAVWRGDKLIASPLTGWEQGWRAGFACDTEEFYSGILAH